MESTSTQALKSDELSSSLQQNYDVTDRNDLICTIILKCKEEMENCCLQKPVEDYVERVANYTGLSKTILNLVISKELKEIDHKYKYFQLRHRMAIFEYIADMYCIKSNPTCKNVFTWYVSNNTEITFSQFQYMMNCLGFEYHKNELGTEILIENPSLTFERYLYLKQINSYRAKCAPIYYIDECFIDGTLSFKKPWINDINISSPTCDGYVFFNAISKQGFLNGLFCSPTSKGDFIKWISHILIPLLPGPSVIVMDNNELHGSLTNTISRYHSKTDMLHYLRQRNIPCNDNLHKAELYELIRRCSVKQECYDVDEIFKAHGHHVLRLPTNFHDLSLSHFLWKYFIDLEPNLFGNMELPQLKIVLLENLNSLPQQLWNNFHEALLATEEDITKIDSKAYKALEMHFKIS